MLFRRAELEAIAAGRVTLAFRHWRRPTVKAGGTLTTRVGVLAIEAVDTIDESAITEADARRAGHDRHAALLEALHGRIGTLYRIAFRVAGPDPRIALRAGTDLGQPETADLVRRLDRLDAASRHGPWTRGVLRQIAAEPGRRAGDLAAAAGRERLAYKRDVRKLKALGLTESLEVGYRLSPRGGALLKRLDRG